MQIEIERLDSTGEPFAHIYGVDELILDEEEARLVSEATVTGRASRKGSVVRLLGIIRANVEVNCDRCAAPISAPLEVKFDTSFVPAEVERKAVEKVELQKDDLEYSIYEGETLDFDELVREQILLALPTRSLCKEECKGLCQTCGKNLNEGECGCAEKEIDPRWSALIGLRKDQE